MLLTSSTCVTVHSFQGSRLPSLPESMSSTYAARSKKLHHGNYKLDRLVGGYMTIGEVRYNNEK
jgi:hypothetical protein